MELRGKYNTAVVFTDNLDKGAAKQLIDICDMVVFKDSKIRVMPDVHVGAGCTIGTTMTVADKIVPNWVGVDIGCSVDVAAAEESQIDFDRLDKHIRQFIPSGQRTNKAPVKQAGQLDLTRLRCAKSITLWPK